MPQVYSREDGRLARMTGLFPLTPEMVRQLRTTAEETPQAKLSSTGPNINECVCTSTTSSLAQSV